MEETGSSLRGELPELPDSPRQLNFDELEELPEDAICKEKIAYAEHLSRQYEKRKSLKGKQL